MTQDPFFAEEDATDPQAAAGFGTQMLALGTAACVGAGLLFGSVVVGGALFGVVLVTMSADAGGGWTSRLRHRARERNCRLLGRRRQSAVKR